MRKEVASEGLASMRTVVQHLRRKVPPAELQAWRDRELAAGRLLEVRVEGWRAPVVALASDRPLLEGVMAGRTPRAWEPVETTTDAEATFFSPLDPVSARGRAKPLFGFDYVWEVYKPAPQRRWGYYTLPVLWGDRLVARFDSRLDRAARTLVVNAVWLEEAGLARDAAFTSAFRHGMDRFLRFLDADATDVSAVGDARIRRTLAVRPRRRRQPPAVDRRAG